MGSISRRLFVRQGSLALLALGLPPEFLTRSLLFRPASAGGAHPLAERGGTARRKTLICIFQRGAVDGLNMVVPFGEKAYYARRRSIAIPAPGRENGAIDLDGFFGLHPMLRPLHDLFARNELAIVHAVGSPHPTRSHFDAQDYMETATPGVKSTRDGWLNRVLSHTECDCGRTLDDTNAHAADHAAGQIAMATEPGVAALRGIAMGTALPRALRGSEPALAIADLKRFGIAGGDGASLEETFSRVYGSDAGTVIGDAAGGALEAVRILKTADPAQYRPARNVEYPRGTFGRSLRQIAQLLKADVGVEVAFADLGGWDTHRAQGGANGQLARQFDQLARGIRALYDDLGDRMDDVAVMTMSEFGRTVAENGSGGTDHGHANCMMVMGGAVAGGRILGDWPGLEREQLYEGRDLALTTDFRDVFGEIVARHLGAERLGEIFPGHSTSADRWRGVLGQA